MKKIFTNFMLVLLCMFAVMMTACNNSNNNGNLDNPNNGGNDTPQETFDATKNITKYTRDTESGTRDGFFTAIGFKEAIKDDTKIPGSVEATGNGDMMAKVKNDEYGIGYISLSSLDNTLKGLNFEGVVPTEENVVNGTYKLSRNFNYITTTEDNCTAAEWLLVQGFILFMTSKEGLAAIKSQGGILTTSLSSAKTYDELLNLPENAAIKTAVKAEGTKITIKFGGSTSVDKVVGALVDAFGAVCPTFNASRNHTGSGDAFKGTQGTEKNTEKSMHIGFLSRELNSSETAATGTAGLMCKDGIVVVVNVKNTSVTNLTAAQLKSIYEGSMTWGQLA